jgi:endoglucanase
VSRPLPPDWATVSERSAHAATSARGFRGSGRFSWDAPRTLVRLAAGPDPGGRAIAARAWPVFRNKLPQDIVVEHHVDGRRAGSSRSAVTLVAAAAAAAANGYRDNAALLLHDAAAQQQERPTYYGSAWTALGRLLLTTRRLDVTPC